MARTIRSLKTDSVRISKQPQRRGQLTGVNIDVLYVGRDVNATVDALRCVPFESGLSEMRSYARATKGVLRQRRLPARRVPRGGAVGRR